MEKLKKLKLGNNIAQLSESEMKSMIGGTTRVNCTKKACSGSGDCSGYCADISSRTHSIIKNKFNLFFCILKSSDFLYRIANKTIQSPTTTKNRNWGKFYYER